MYAKSDDDHMQHMTIKKFEKVKICPLEVTEIKEKYVGNETAGAKKLQPDDVVQSSGF